MKLETAQFFLRDSKLGLLICEGHPRHVVNNCPGKWGVRPYKPCATHATELAREKLLAKPPVSEHDKQRRGKVTPGLRIHK